MATEIKFLEWRGLRLERRTNYRSERYEYVAESGACWIVERLENSKSWIAWFIAMGRVRFMNPAETSSAALEGVYFEAMQLSGQLQSALSEVD